MLRNARPPAKPARQSPEAKPMADGQSEADGSAPKKRYPVNPVKNKKIRNKAAKAP